MTKRGADLQAEPSTGTGASSVILRPTLQALAEVAGHESKYYLPEDPKDLLHADPARRIATTFGSAGVELAGHLYRPPGVEPGEVTAGVVLCGPISSVKEQTVPHYAERLADAGYTALTFDPRNFGESGGEPRGHYDPSLIIEDYASAVDYLISRGDIDADRLAVVGICMGGGYAVSVGARDKRLRAVVSIAGGYNIGGTFQQFLGVDGLASYLKIINGLLQREYETGTVEYIPTCVEALSDDVPVAAMASAEAYSYYMRTSAADAPNWPRALTAASIPAYFSYNSVPHAPLVAPTPLLVVHGTTDGALLPEHAQSVYDAALGQKELVWLETHNHIELYDQDPYVSEAASYAVRWLDTHCR
jgi:uncharacterized protein